MKITNFLLIVVIILFSSISYAESSMETAIKHSSLVSEALNNVTEVPSIPENWKEIVENGIRGILKDPESARFRYPNEKQKYCGISNISDGIAHKITLSSKSPLLGYSGIVFVNAKNSFGGYVGEEPYWYMITDGELSLIQNVKADDSDGALSSLYGPINSIFDIQFATIRWRGNYFMCKE